MSALRRLKQHIPLEKKYVGKKYIKKATTLLFKPMTSKKY